MHILRIIALIVAVCLCFATAARPSVAQDLSIYEHAAAKERVPLPAENRAPTASALQDSLVELIDLSLSTKQAHWNVSGPLFYSLHDLLDHFVADYREDADLVAERLLAIGLTADGRPGVVSKTANLPTFPEGYISDYNVVELLSQRLNMIGKRFRDRIERLDDVDLVSQDVLIDVERQIAKHVWMLREFQQQSAGSNIKAHL